MAFITSNVLHLRAISQFPGMLSESSKMYALALENFIEGEQLALFYSYYKKQVFLSYR